MIRPEKLMISASSGMPCSRRHEPRFASASVKSAGLTLLEITPRPVMP